MSDIDTNLQNEEKDEELQEIDARCMTEDDVQAIVNIVVEAGIKVKENLDCINNGTKYEETLESLKQFAVLIINGTHRDFARRNSTNGNISFTFDDGKPNPGQNSADRLALKDLWYAGNEKKASRAFTSYIYSFIAEALLPACRINVFFKDMAGCNENAQNALASALDGFAKFCDRYNSGSIYRELTNVSKNKSFEENHKEVLAHMNAHIADYNCLNLYLSNTQYTNASGMNELFVLDKKTREFNGFYEKLPIFKKYMDDAAEVETALTENAEKYKSCVQNYYISMRSVLRKITQILYEAEKTIEKFSKWTTEFPYCLMSYPTEFNKVAGKYLNIAVNNPTVSGTRYNEMAKEMLKKMQSLAVSVAKGAAKWAEY